MEHRNLAKTGFPTASARLWRRCSLFCALISFVSLAFAQYPASDDPQYELIFKVNGKCGDTILLMRHPTSWGYTWRSRSRCKVDLGFGKMFQPADNRLLILDGSQLSLLMGYHRDKVLEIKAEEQYVISPYGAYRVKLKEESLLGGKWKTWTFLLKPDQGSGATIVLQLNRVLGVIGIQHLDRNRVTVGQIELIKVDSLLLDQFVKQSNIE